MYIGSEFLLYQQYRVGRWPERKQSGIAYRPLIDTKGAMLNSQGPTKMKSEIFIL